MLVQNQCLCTMLTANLSNQHNIHEVPSVCLDHQLYIQSTTHKVSSHAVTVVFCTVSISLEHQMLVQNQCLCTMLTANLSNQHNVHEVPSVCLDHQLYIQSTTHKVSSHAVTVVFCTVSISLEHQMLVQNQCLCTMLTANLSNQHNVHEVPNVCLDHQLYIQSTTHKVSSHAVTVVFCTVSISLEHQMLVQNQCLCTMLTANLSNQHNIHEVPSVCLDHQLYIQSTTHKVSSHAVTVVFCTVFISLEHQMLVQNQCLCTMLTANLSNQHNVHEVPNVCLDHQLYIQSTTHKVSSHAVTVVFCTVSISLEHQMLVQNQCLCTMLTANLSNQHNIHEVPSVCLDHQLYIQSTTHKVSSHVVTVVFCTVSM